MISSVFQELVEEDNFNLKALREKFPTSDLLSGTTHKGRILLVKDPYLIVAFGKKKKSVISIVKTKTFNDVTPNDEKYSPSSEIAFKVINTNAVMKEHKGGKQLSKKNYVAVGCVVAEAATAKGMEIESAKFNLEVGQFITGTVSKIRKFNVFVTLTPKM